ncbi:MULTISPECIES: glycosyltransferase [Microbacterium]|uniref:glycosyltransferase n=1 Tax=Microbacterium TaxID=33882 RepID=UPI0027875C7E|nr:MULTISPECIES: glycosyltransferase [Microbacterium]MDQ1074391.1 glycosyltransferase involved in cell wall biosynthesis [Microbacterium sp. SORGH_AS_0969]MDQ1114621.1 glycosyltransferase involved in cell wall biosynthesis [Microbacterium testaceum]
MGSRRTPSVAIIGTRGYPSYYGGFETAVRRLSPYLVDHGWDVSVYGRPGAVESDDPERDLRVVSRMTSGIDSRALSTLSYGFTSTFDAARRRPDVALIMNVANGFWLPMLRARRIPTIVNVDGLEWKREKWSALGKAVFRAGAHVTAKWSTERVVDARTIGDAWQSRFGVGGEFIPYGADVPPPLPVEPGFEHRGYALLVARFVPENTVGPFFDAAERLAQTHDVIAVGSAGYGGELDERAATLDARLPRFHWFGHVHDDQRLHSLWQHAGAYFHGHNVGGTNPALVQAMAAGAPIVARDTVHSREVLGSAAGEFTGPEPAKIEAALRGLLTDPERQQRLSEAAVRRARDAYSWESVNAAYERLLRSHLRPDGDDAPRPNRQEREG